MTEQETTALIQNAKTLAELRSAIAKAELFLGSQKIFTSEEVLRSFDLMMTLDDPTCYPANAFTRANGLRAKIIELRNAASKHPSQERVRQKAIDLIAKYDLGNAEEQPELISLLIDMYKWSRTVS